MADPKDDKKPDLNRFGNKAETAIPKDAPLAANPGHKLRASNVIVDRKKLPPKNAVPDPVDSSKIEKLENSARLRERKFLFVLPMKPSQEERKLNRF